MSMTVGDIRAIIEGLPDNTFFNVTTQQCPPEVSSIFPRSIAFHPVGNGPHCTTSQGARVVGSVDLVVDVVDATWGHAEHEILMSYIRKARLRALKQLRKKGYEPKWAPQVHE